MVRVDDSYMVHLSSNLLLKFCGSLLKVYNLTLNKSRTEKKTFKMVYQLRHERTVNYRSNESQKINTS